MLYDDYTYAKCSFTNNRVTMDPCTNCTKSKAASDQDLVQDDFVHAKYQLSNCSSEDVREKCSQGKSHKKDTCKNCVKSQCSPSKRNDLLDDCTNDVNYVYDFCNYNQDLVSENSSIYFVYHVSKAVYKFLLHFKFHFLICSLYVSLDRFVTRPVMLYLVQFKSHMLLGVNV